MQLIFNPILTTIVFVVALIFVLVMTYSTWRRRRRWTVILFMPLWAFSLVTLLGTGILFWYTNRPQPAPRQVMLFQGVEYIREVRNDPRPMVIHVIRVDLDAPGIEFLVTPHTPTADRALAARTTSDFLAEFDLQVAVNGDFFAPWWDEGPWDYYPHRGDPVDVRGASISRGDAYTSGFVPNSNNTLFISRDNQAAINQTIGGVYNAISGFEMLVRNGNPFTPRGGTGNAYLTTPQPRTTIGLDATSQTLIIIVVDGRQPNYSEGATIEEIAQILLQYGAYNAINLDGGGSSTLAIEDADDDPHTLNSPVHNRIPGRERPVPNHLGIYALPLIE